MFIASDAANADRVVGALRTFGFSSNLAGTVFTEPNRIIRMGVPPIRIEILTTISGIEFQIAYARRIVVEMDGVPVNLIALDDLKANKKASGRHKDLADVDELEKLRGSSRQSQ